MKAIKYSIMALLLGWGTASCTDLDEKTYANLPQEKFFESELSVKSAVASIYNTAAYSYLEYFYYLQEFSADQVAWRSWNGGLWGYDEGEKFVLSTHSWTAESKIIRQTWEKAWETIGLCNAMLDNVKKDNPALKPYIAETRTLRAWAYYNIFEIWGGALPLSVSSASSSVATADPDFDTSCKKIYNFISTELDESLDDLPKETGDCSTHNRMSQAANRLLKARLLLNGEVLAKEKHFDECKTICQKIISGDYGNYELAKDYRDIFDITNTQCKEVIFAFATEVSQLNIGWMRDMPFLPYVYDQYFGGKYSQDGWNCVCLAPSYNNVGKVQPQGGTDGGQCFLDAPYNDKLGAIYERFDNKDVRKQNYIYDDASTDKYKYKGMFLKGAMKKDFGKGDFLKADADRDGEDLWYVDQVGTFKNLGRELEPVMSPRWGETNSGIRLMKYPIYPESAGIDYQDIDEVEFRLSEAYYMLAECLLREGNTSGAKSYVDQVYQRYFEDGKVPALPFHEFKEVNEDWMLHMWGLEFLNEGRRRRTDLRRFDKFTQGQWWFFGRATDNGKAWAAKRDRKYEWFPLPASAITVNPGLIQNPNY